ncbi:MAG: cytochrome C biogenesis protein CcsB [Thermus sp.]|uniref:c-type cytochrome n=1 Tax=Thermus sp. TaxID=275 RepID=UPI00332274A6
MKQALGAVLALSLALAQSGSGLFSQYCQVCHQAGGQGLAGSFPPLAGHVQEILAKKDGRTYLVNVLLYGLQGEIVVKGKKYNGAMPAWGSQLKDAEIAAILNYISTSFGNKLPPGQKPFTDQEVKAQRSKPLTPQQVYAWRKKLGL